MSIYRKKLENMYAYMTSLAKVTEKGTGSTMHGKKLKKLLDTKKVCINTTNYNLILILIDLYLQASAYKACDRTRTPPRTSETPMTCE